jgi:cyclopropane fatty-acyl-phospholipid synthase-like methyltransferase
LLFRDQTLTRLGADTFFSFTQGTRDLTLERGTLLLQVPKGRGGARIRTAAVTASITGTTILLEHTAKRRR